MQAPAQVKRWPLAALLTGNLISGAGNFLAFMAIPWFVLETTGSASQTSFVAAMTLIATVPAGILGGAIADRLGRVRCSVVADIASCLAVAAIPLLHATIGLQIWQLMLLVFLGALLDVPGMVARRSMTPELATLAGLSLERATTLEQLTTRIAGIAGPLLAGVLIAAFGSSTVLWIDAATFIVSAVMVGAIGVRKAWQAAPREAAGVSAIIGDLREGWSFLTKERVILQIIVTFALIGMVSEPFYGLLLPVFVKEVYDTTVPLGVLYAALAAGSVAGNLLYLALAPRLPRGPAVLFAFAVRAAMFWVFVAFPPLPISVLAIGIGAVVLEPTNPILLTSLQERVPQELRGRVFGVLIALMASVRPIGLLIYGVMIEEMGLRETLMVVASISLLTPVALLFLPTLRHLERRPTAGATAALS